MHAAKRKKRRLWGKLAPVLAAVLVLLAAKGHQIAGASAPAPAPDYDWSSPVPESAPVDESWFDDAVFIGNSRTEGFALYSGLGNIRAFTERGVMVDTVFTAPAVNVDGQKVSIMDAVARESFSRCYIMLGMNELGWRSLDLFSEKYGRIIDSLRSTHPDADIYVQSILPVTAERSAEDPVYNNENVEKFNALIRRLCEEKQVYYLSVEDAVSGPDGALPEDAAFDGIHLKADWCKLWLEYLEAHTV